MMVAPVVLPWAHLGSGVIAKVLQFPGSDPTNCPSGQFGANFRLGQAMIVVLVLEQYTAALQVPGSDPTKNRNIVTCNARYLN